MRRRVFIHKDCDQEIFKPMFMRYPHHLKVGTEKHAFFSSTLWEVLGDTSVEYPKMDLSEDEEMDGQALYEFIKLEIGENNYMGAIETTEAQCDSILDYLGDSILEGSA